VPLAQAHYQITATLFWYLFSEDLSRSRVGEGKLIPK